ncbi:MAG: histidine kinase, partial [Desulfosarcinaceae bacterium]
LKKWTIGPYQGEHINEDAVLYFSTPVLDRTQTLVAVAFAALNLDWMNRTVFKLLAELPVGSRLTLLDEYHGMLRYTADTDRWSVPDSYDPALRKRIVGHGSGTITSTDEAGVMRIHAFAPVSGSFRTRQVTMVLEIPQKIAFSASSRVFLRNLAMLFASALIAVVSIWWTADVFILRRVRAMVAVTRKLADGELDARIGRIGGSDELSHLAGVFDEMAASLQKRIEHETQVMASLEQSREQLRKLAAYQQEVREEERLRIAREIHDEFGQCLTILKMDLAWLNKQLSPKLGEIVEKMQSMSQVIEEALKNLHAVTAELRPVILDDFGLAAAIEWQIDEFRKRSGINCNLESNGFEPDLPKDQATALFRIFQETLTNILRHAQADDVEVRLQEHEGVLVLDVHDNGRGITTDEINHPMSYGLLGMRERLYPWNGRVTFQGRPGRGTRVTIELPLPGKGAQV